MMVYIYIYIKQSEEKPFQSADFSTEFYQNQNSNT